MTPTANKLILFVLLATSLNSSVLAQKDTLRSNVYGAYFIFPFEFPAIDNAQINNELTTHGYPTCNYPLATTGIGLQLYTNRWITTFSFNKTTNKTDKDTYLTEVEYRSTSFNIGYDLTKNYKYSFYPFAGYKGCGLNYIYREKIPGGASFNDYLNSNQEYKELGNSLANLDLGFGFSARWLVQFDFRAGYLLPLEKSQWKINDSQDILMNSPTLKYKYYFIITFGLGGISSDNNLRRHHTFDV